MFASILMLGFSFTVKTCNAKAGTSWHITLEVYQTCFPGILIFWMWNKKAKIHSQTETRQQILKSYSQVCNVWIPNVNVQIHIHTLHESSTAWQQDSSCWLTTGQWTNKSARTANSHWLLLHTCEQTGGVPRITNMALFVLVYVKKEGEIWVWRAENHIKQNWLIVHHFLHRLKFQQTDCSGCYLLQAGFSLSLFFNADDRGNFQQISLHYIPDERTHHNHSSENLMSYRKLMNCYISTQKKKKDIQIYNKILHCNL